VSSNLIPTTSKCVHLVTRDHFRSRDKDGGHTIRFVISKEHATRKLHGSMFHGTGVIADRNVTLQE